MRKERYAGFTWRFSIFELNAFFFFVGQLSALTTRDSVTKSTGKKKNGSFCMHVCRPSPAELFTRLHFILVGINAAAAATALV